MTLEEIDLFGRPLNSCVTCVTTCTHRRCSKCKTWKTNSEFGKHKRANLGLNHSCRICTRLYDKGSKARKQANKILRAGIEAKYGKLLTKDIKCRTTATHKMCSKCKEWKAHSKFHRRLGDLVSHCIRCAKNHKLTSAYGISIEEYEQMNEAQGGLCQICGDPQGGKHAHMDLFVDHDHETGEVRGLLCHGCNVALGSMRDDPTLLRKAANYLEKQ